MATNFALSALRRMHMIRPASLFSSASASQVPIGSADKTLQQQPQHRLSKFIADHVAISRREAERLIRAGEVKLAGQIVTSPQILVELKDLQNSALQVQGKVVMASNAAAAKKRTTNATTLQETTTRVWLAHKLAGEIVSDSDPLGRPSLLERLARGGVGKQGKQKLHLKPVGRLDMPTEGLILLTNDGAYARQLELPASLIHRVYRVRAHGNITDYKLAQIQKGLTIDGIRYAPMKVQLDGGGKQQSTNKWLQVTCAEGKNRQIRKVFKQLGLDVTRLIRTGYGDYQLRTIPPGMAVEVNCKPVKLQRRRGSLFPKRRPKVEQEKQTSDNGSSPVQWVSYL